MQQPLLIEIGVEELPAIPLLMILKQIQNSWTDILAKYKLECEFEFFYTPRRLVLKHKAFPTKQQDSNIELFGPPLQIAIKDGNPTPAGLGFAKKCGVEFDKLQRVEKNNKEILYYQKQEIGMLSKELLEDMINEWISSMNFGKMMRWGSRSDEFIRPVRWLQVRLANESVEVELFGVKSDKNTYVHRMVSYEPQLVNNIDDYEQILSMGAVMLNQKDRYDLIVSEFDDIETRAYVTIDRDKALLDEVVAITENPKALLGSFDESFLQLPPEVIITSMKEHQRYFPVFKDGKITNKFVMVSNAYTDDYSKVIAGNERVLKPRLADALFFYENDLRNGLSVEGLEKVQFIDGLGTLTDKIDREKEIALRLLALYMDKLEKETNRSSLKLEELMDRAITLAKADLMSEMVYEFTELQGLMGYYYAKALGEDELVYNAIKEQYMPVGEGAELPSNLFSSIVAMSIKLDTLIGLFSVGKIPTGSKDPFALRRAVNGIVRIITNNDISFDIDKMIDLLSQNYKEYNKAKLKEFIIERIYKSFDANASVISAVLESGDYDINNIYKKVKALNEIVSSENFKEQFSTFKRVANISKDIDLSQNLSIDTTLFENDAEVSLYNAYEQIINTTYDSYKAKLEALFALKPLLDRYFDDVLVNAEDSNLKTNRQHQVASIYKAFKEIADIKEISI